MPATRDRPTQTVTLTRQLQVCLDCCDSYNQALRESNQLTLPLGEIPPLWSEVRREWGDQQPTVSRGILRNQHDVYCDARSGGECTERCDESHYSQRACDGCGLSSSGQRVYFTVAVRQVQHVPVDLLSDLGTNELK